MESRLSENATDNFFDRLPRLNLQTFSSITQSKAVKVSEKEVILKADRNLFGKMALIAQTRQLNMREVLQHSLGTFPWASATGEGSLKKTNKAATLANEIEKLAIATDCIPRPTARVIDAMSIIQKHKDNQKSFAELANTLFLKFKAEASECGRIDVVFDVYEDESIKGAVRSDRGAAEATQFKNLIVGHKIKLWKKGSSDKASLIRFLCKEWKKAAYRGKLDGKEMFLAYDQEC